MAPSSPPAAETPPAPRPGLSPLALVLILGATQVVGYGTLYYAFAVLAGSIAAEFGWPSSWAFGLFSVALFVGGMVAPLVGRRIDRHGAGRVMALGSAGAGLALAAAALSPHPLVFALFMVAAQVASTGALYDAAFTAIVQLCGGSARQRITHLTLIAGFASTIFWPATTWLHERLDWRSVYLIYAAANLAIGLPLHLLVARLGRPVADPAPSAPPAAGARPPAPAKPPAFTEAEATRAFHLVSGGFALSGFLLSALLAQMVPVLTGLGLGASALWVSALFGPAQVLVRFVNLVFGVGRHPVTVALFAMAMFPLSVAGLALTAPSVPGAAVAAILFGFGSGLKSIVHGTVPLALFGAASYGARLGRMAMARAFMAAVAPFSMALAIDGLGATAALLVFAAVGLSGVAAFAEVQRMLTVVAARSAR